MMIDQKKKKNRSKFGNNVVVGIFSGGDLFLFAIGAIYYCHCIRIIWTSAMVACRAIVAMIANHIINIIKLIGCVSHCISGGMSCHYHIIIVIVQYLTDCHIIGQSLTFTQHGSGVFAIDIGCAIAVVARYKIGQPFTQLLNEELLQITCIFIGLRIVLLKARERELLYAV